MASAQMDHRPGEEDAPWFEATIASLQRQMARGRLSSRELTRAYLGRARAVDPLLHSIIETNPDAMAIAARRDAERRAGHVRGPLHGIPVLLKDNIATDDRMETTAGSLALVGSRVPRDAVVTRKLREAGAVVIGKANLSEWANFRGFVPDAVSSAGLSLNGWSARGGFTRDPYVLSWDPCGSSSGSGVAVSANLCSVAVGTETDGSIVCPAGNSGVVGLKPTVGLVAQRGIIPISHSQDTAGPMGRTVSDVATLLNVLVSPFGEVKGRRLPRDYRRFLRRGAIKGKRIGVDRRLFSADHDADPSLVAVTEAALDVMRSLGATIVDPVDGPDPKAFIEHELAVMLAEFKVDMKVYLKGLRHTRIRSLADLIAFDRANCDAELRYFGQEVFEIAQSTLGLADPAYIAARALGLDLTRTNGYDRLMAELKLDAIASPTSSSGSSGPAVAGYPIISVPTGVTDDGRPGGIWLSAGFLDEQTLLAIAYDLEQEIGGRPKPTYRGSVPDLPPDAGLCASPVPARVVSTDALDAGRMALERTPIRRRGAVQAVGSGVSRSTA